MTFGSNKTFLTGVIWSIQDSFLSINPDVGDSMGEKGSIFCKGVINLILPSGDRLS
jgi:hypothetical protein